MYAETGLMYQYFQNFFQEFQQLDEFFYSPKPSSSLDSIIPLSTIDLGGEGDLFKAPEPIIEEPMVGLKVCDMELLQNEQQLLSDIFDGCRKELLEKTSMETAVSDVLDMKLPIVTDEVQSEQGKSLSDLPFTRSGSSGYLSSMELRPNFLDFPDMDFGAAYGMRRAFSEGDIKTLSNGNLSLIHYPLQRPLVIGNCTSEDRLQKLSRYRNKKSRRNFGRKIKYACRKALADSQPRIRGRFAKTEETDSCKKEHECR